MPTLTITFTAATPAPPNGYTLKYRVKGSSDAYTSIPAASSPVTIPNLAYNTEYEGYIESDCGDGFNSEDITFATCNCPPTYTVNDNKQGCTKIDVQDADVTYSNYCLAPSKLIDYSQFFTRIYKSGFSNSSIALASAPSSDVLIELTTSPQWKDATTSSDYTSTLGVTNFTGNSSLLGPMNRAGVWVDSDCDGKRNALGGTIQSVNITQGGSGYIDGTYTDVEIKYAPPYINTTARGTVIVVGGTVTNVIITDGGTAYSPGNPLTIDNVYLGSAGAGVQLEIAEVIYQKTTIAFAYNNTGAARLVYVGIGSDNQFILKVNGVNVASTTVSNTQYNFKVWHIFPVTLLSGTNYFNAISTGDGSVNDAVGMTVYDNTSQELINATSDSQLNVLFTSSSLIGQHIDIATCPNGYDLDISEGVGNYKCRRKLSSACTGVIDSGPET